MQRPESGKRPWDHGSVCLCGGAAWSVPSVRICFAFEFVNECRSLTQPFEPLLGGQSMEFGVAVEILRFALGQRALEFFALISCAESSRIPGHELGLRRRPVSGSRSYPIAIVVSSRSSKIVNFSSNGKAADSASVCRLCLRQAARSSGDNEFREARLFTTAQSGHVAPEECRAVAPHRQGPAADQPPLSWQSTLQSEVPVLAGRPTCAAWPFRILAQI